MNSIPVVLRFSNFLPNHCDFLVLSALHHIWWIHNVLLADIIWPGSWYYMTRESKHMDFSTGTLYWLTNWLNHELPDRETGFYFWVRQLRFQFWIKPKSGNCGRFQFWAYPKVETADAFPVLGRFHFWACTTLSTQEKTSIFMSL